MRQWLIDARKAKAMSQKRMSELVEVAQPTYWAYERGLSRPSPIIAKRIAEVLDIPWWRFFDESA